LIGKQDKFELSLACLKLIHLVENQNQNEATLLSINEAIYLLKSEVSTNKVKEMKHFKSAFGRGLNYISFVKEQME